MTAVDPHENVAAGGSAWVVQARKTAPWTTPEGAGDEVGDPGDPDGEVAPLQAVTTRTRLAALSAARRRIGRDTLRRAAVVPTSVSAGPGRPTTPATPFGFQRPKAMGLTMAAFTRRA
jgi:hypothetical protein